MGEQGATPKLPPEEARIRRLRANAKRPMSVNLAEGIALSHQLMRFTGVACAKDLADLEDLDAAHGIGRQERPSP